MEIQYHRNFVKQYKKLDRNIQQQFLERQLLWLKQPDDPRLRVHPLKGKFMGHWSMNVSGDVRAIYSLEGERVVIFLLIGTHSQLYGK
jgi:addiction module RelE/StbE family toxin